MERCVWILVAVLLVPAGVEAQSRQAQSRPSPPTQAQPTRDIGTFPGLARVFRDVAGTASADPEQEAARLFDFEQMLMAIAGMGAPAAESMEEYREAFEGTRRLAVVVRRGAAARDDTAYRLHSLGYSAKEVADVIAGRITRSALDTAQKMVMLGARREHASDFLDREYGRLQAAREKAERERERLARKGAAGAGAPRDVASLVEADVVRFASMQNLDARLVRAVITRESGWNVDAISRVGAVGLMQLMPGTARELGVDPRDARQNVEGGTRYLAGLLRVFKSLEHALVAYNAGPGFAARYARGEAVLYGETREFVKAVLQEMAAAGR